ncbi:uncharacterized protein [Apostichopus japonicus]|uniref:uncharacterized protein isoform X1 n=1 Tax=Stichopus japonicus TaxID=307972 RepID=UPI003AB2AAB3
MKKRKELDALLMNGKKSRPKRSKDGHELLQNLDSESNSSEFDEFIMQPRKQTVVRRKGALCSLCIRLFLFVLIAGCISLTFGVILMHLELKHDLDVLRKRLETVETRSQPTDPLNNSITDLQSKVGHMPALLTKVGNLNTSIINLQEVINKLQKTVKDLQDSSTSHTEDNSKIGENINQVNLALQAAKADLTDKVGANEESITTLKTDVASLTERVTQLSQSSSSTTDKPDGSNTGVTTPDNILVLQQSLEAINKTVNSLNDTIDHLNTEVLALRGASSSQGDSTGMELLDVLQKNVTYLMAIVQKEISGDDNDVANPDDGSPPTTAGGSPPLNVTVWQSAIEGRLRSLEVTVQQLNPGDLNNNLLNNETTRGFQTILEQTYGVFREEIHGNLQGLEDGLQILNESSVQHDVKFNNVLQRLDGLESTVKSLQNATQASEDTITTAEPQPDTEPQPDNEPPTTPVKPPIAPPAKVLTSPPIKTPDNPPAGGIPESSGSKAPKTEDGEIPPAEGTTISEQDAGTTMKPPTTTDSELQSELTALTGIVPSRTMRSTLIKDLTTNILNSLISEQDLPTSLLMLTGSELPTGVSEKYLSPTNQKTSSHTNKIEQLTLTTKADIKTSPLVELSLLNNEETTIISTASKTTPKIVSTTTTSTPLPVLSIQGVNSYNALRRNFSAWDRNRDKKLSFGEFSRISDVRKHRIPESTFKLYDSDGDSHLSLGEMRLAMHL